MRVKYFNVATVFFLVLTLIGFIFIDKSIALFFHQHFANSNLTHFSEQLGKLTATKHVIFVGVLISGLAIILLQRNKILSKSPWAVVAVTYAFSVAVAFAIKVTLARYRPELFFADGAYGFHFFSFKHSMNSMPSGHTVTAYALLLLPGLFVWDKSKIVGGVLMFCGIFLAFSRILTTEHYFSDVMLSGALVSFIAARYLKSLSAAT